MLIAIGVLFALDHVASVPFERSWPVIIILIGILKLLERVFGAEHPVMPYAPPPTSPTYPQAPPYAGGNPQ